jgi:hypothetical protein
MMEGSSPLDRRLREARYRRGTQVCAQILESIGIPTTDLTFASLEEIDEIWPRFLQRLREDAASATRFSVEERVELQRQLDNTADTLGGLRVIWFALIDSEPVGVEVAAAVLLRAASVYFVSAATDLMLASRDTNHGISVEFNHLPSGDQYEVVAWGAFAG